MRLELRSDTASFIKGRAWTYLWPKLKLDQMSYICLEIIGLEYEVGILIGDLDDVHRNLACWCR